MKGISDQTLIKAVRIAYRKKGRAVTTQEVVPAVKRLIGDKKPPKRPKIIQRAIDAVVNHEIHVALDTLGRKNKIKWVYKNHKEYFAPL